MSKDTPTSLITPEDRPEKDGKGVAYNVPDDLIRFMSDELKLPPYIEQHSELNTLIEMMMGELDPNLDDLDDTDLDEYPMEAILNDNKEICFEDGMQIELDEKSRRVLKEHWKHLSTSKRPIFEKFIRRSHGNFCRTLSLLG